MLQAFKSMSQNSRKLDLLGVLAASICMLHCLALPVLLGSLPFLSSLSLDADWTHEVLAALVLIVALSAVLPAYLKHRNRLVLTGLVAGLAFVLFATFACGHMLEESLEIPLISIGNLIIMATHLRNRSLSCKNC